MGVANRPNLEHSAVLGSKTCLNTAFQLETSFEDQQCQGSTAH